MIENKPKTLGDLAREVGRFPEDAFLFVREGLGRATEQVHGPETPAHRALQEYITQRGIDWNELIREFDANLLPEPVVAAIQAAGGADKLNRHITGRQLCWGLRDYALRRWGMLARTVLESWRIRSTEDFGRIVFAFIDYDLMQKQPDDSISDFEDVYQFDEAFGEDACAIEAIRDYPSDEEEELESEEEDEMEEL